MEKKFNNWLVVSDIDGTLNSKLRKLPKNNYDAIKEFTELGGNFTLASGRPVSSLRRNYKRITPNQPAIVLNGAGIYDYKEEKMIWRNTIGEKGRNFVKEVSNAFNTVDNSVDIGIFLDDEVYILGAGVLSRGQMFFDKTKNTVVKKFEDLPSDGWMKVIFWSNPITMKKIVSFCNNHENPDVNFMASSIWSYEMLQKDTHKGNAVMKLAEMIGIDKEHVAAIGDYYNDWDMLKTVGYPACAGQAPKPIHEICKYEACHCNKGCVADLLNHIMNEI